MPKCRRPFSQLAKGSQKRAIVSEAKRALDALGRGEGKELLWALLKSEWGKPIMQVYNFY